MEIAQIENLGDFLGGPVVKTPCFQCKCCGFDPGQGNTIPHAMWRGKKKKKGFPGDSHVQSHLGSDVKKRKPWPLRWLMFTLFAL